MSLLFRLIDFIALVGGAAIAAAGVMSARGSEHGPVRRFGWGVALLGIGFALSAVGRVFGLASGTVASSAFTWSAAGALLLGFIIWFRNRHALREAATDQ